MAIQLSMTAGQVTRPILGLAPGQLVAVTPGASSSAFVEYCETAGNGDDEIVNGNATWYPWPAGTITAAKTDVVTRYIAARVTCVSGSCSVNIGDSSAQNLVPWYAWASRGAAPNYPAGVVVVGDSITARNTSSTASTVANGITGYWTWANILLGQRFRLLANKGVSGDKTANVIARLPDIVAQSPSMYAVMIGINDVTADTIASSDLIANLQTIYTSLLNTGAMVLAFTILPSTSVSTGGRKQKLYLANNFIRDYCAKTPRMLIVDSYSAWADPSSGSPASGYTSDGTHPTQIGASAIGRAIYEVLNPLYPVNQSMESNNFDYSNLAYNGMCNGNNASGTNGWTLSGSITGNGPDGWRSLSSGTGAGVASKVNRTDWRQGTWAKMALTATAAADSAQFEIRCMDNITRANTTAYTLGQRANVTGVTACQFVCTTAGTSSGSAPTFDTQIGNTTTDGTVTWTAVEPFAAGDSVYAQAAFTADSFSGAAHVEMFVLCLDSASTTLLTTYANFTSGESITTMTYMPASGAWRTPDFTIPATTARIYVRLKAQGNAGVTGNMLVSNIEIRKSQTLISQY